MQIRTLITINYDELMEGGFLNLVQTMRKLKRISFFLVHANGQETDVNLMFAHVGCSQGMQFYLQLLHEAKPGVITFVTSFVTDFCC